MVDLHGVGERHVEIARLQMPHALDRQLARHLQRAAFQVPVLGAFRRAADAERRHQLVEEAIEMVGPEHHHEIGLELVQRRGAALQLVEELGLRALLGFFHLRRHQR